MIHLENFHQFFSGNLWGHKIKFSCLGCPAPCIRPGPAFEIYRLFFRKLRMVYILIGVMLAVGSYGVYASGFAGNGIITAHKLNMRSAPGMDRPPVKILYKGATVRILKYDKEWLYVAHEGETGYIRNREVYVYIDRRPQKGKKEKAVVDTPLDKNAEKLKKESKVIDRKIKKHRAEVQAFTRKETALVDSLNEIDLSIHNARKRISKFKAELAILEKKIKITAEASQTLIKEIKTSETYMSKRLVALYKLNWLGSIHVLASAESISDLFQRKTSLERILYHDEKIRQQLILNKVRLEETVKELNFQKKEKRSIEEKYKQQFKIMSYEKAKRSSLLTEIRKKKSLELAAIDSLKRAAFALDRKIKSLNVEIRRPRKKEKLSGKLFAELKGLLNMPVKGKIINRFGFFKNTGFNIENFRSGIDIRAERGEPIRAVSDGKILYSSWFKGYGNMVIIDHGNNYYTVYAYVEELFKAKGDTVESDEVVATVGGTGFMTGAGLYFEVRHHGKPLDPLLWIKKS